MEEATTGTSGEVVSGGSLHQLPAIADNAEPPPPTIPLASEALGTPSGLVLKRTSAKVIAQQMTYLDTVTFAQIKPEEMLLGNWTRPNKEEGSFSPQLCGWLAGGGVGFIATELTILLLLLLLLLSYLAAACCSGAHAHLPGQLLQQMVVLGVHRNHHRWLCPLSGHGCEKVHFRPLRPLHAQQFQLSHGYHVWPQPSLCFQV